MDKRVMSCSILLAVVSLVLTPVALAQGQDIPRTPSGRPDLSGTYDVSTLTPMQRPVELGTKMSLTDEEAAEVAEQERRRMAERNAPSDPNRGAPPQGGDGSQGASGNVGGYNSFWIDRGSSAFKVDGEWRTSILIDPPDGAAARGDSSHFPCIPTQLSKRRSMVRAPLLLLGAGPRR